VFIHCWLVLKDISCWMETLGELRQHASRMAIAVAQRRPTVPLPPRHYTPTSTSLELEFGDKDNDVGVEEATQPMATTWGKRGGLMGAKSRRRSSVFRSNGSKLPHLACWPLRSTILSCLPSLGSTVEFPIILFQLLCTVSTSLVLPLSLFFISSCTADCEGLGILCAY
jgi:hypothetical protein